MEIKEKNVLYFNSQQSEEDAEEISVMNEWSQWIKHQDSNK